MRAVVDATPVLLRSAGVKTYLYHLAQALRATAAGRSLAIFPYLDSVRELNHQKSPLCYASTRARTCFVSLLNMRLLNLRRMSLVDAFVRADVFHFSQALVFPPRRAKLTATLYDMTCWTVPETHTAANVAATRAYVDLIRRRADAAIAISEATRADAIRIAGFPERKVHVVYPGVADPYFTVDGAAAERARRVYGLTKPYLLCVGGIEPRKNMDRVLDAWLQIRSELRAEFEFVIVGPRLWASPATISRIEQKRDGGVRYLGYVSESILPGLTAGAYASVYASLYEGFGFPLAQSLAAGVPAVTSNTSSMPEVAGDASILVDPRSVCEIRSALERLLESQDFRDRLAIRAPAQAGRFRWSDSARRTWSVFENVCGGA
jgi:glycosyltransferase involved in cell wall biosynthesis